MLTKADLKKVREIVFLKDVLFIALSAFGGPEMHISLFLQKLVQEKRYINETDLMELNSLCQILPGPSSTQTLTAIAYKLGGPRLAFLALIIWIMPAAALMSLFAITTGYANPSIFRFIGPMAIGFVFMAAINMTRLLKKKTLNIVLASIAAVMSVIFHTPYAFPIFLILGAMVTVNFGPKDYVPNTKPLLNIRWANLSLMVLILVTVAVLGTFTKTKFPHISQPVRLFENTYRMGSMVFGGGNVLYSMMLTEFVEYRPKQYLTIQEFNTGLGLLQAVPGPTFTIATYANGIAMKKLGYDVYGQLIGCGIGTLAIFLPGTLLIFFVYPIWNQVKTYPIIYRSLDGIISVSIGFLWSAAIFMAMPYFSHEIVFNQSAFMPLLVFGLTLLYLQYKKLPPFLLVIVTILAGYLL